MDSHIHMKASIAKGFGKSIKRMFGGESIVVNTFTAQGAPGEVTFAPGPMGDLHASASGSDAFTFFGLQGKKN